MFTLDFNAPLKKRTRQVSGMYSELDKTLFSGKVGSHVLAREMFKVNQRRLTQHVHSSVNPILHKEGRTVKMSTYPEGVYLWIEEYSGKSRKHTLHV